MSCTTKVPGVCTLHHVGTRHGLACIPTASPASQLPYLNNNCLACITTALPAPQSLGLHHYCLACITTALPAPQPLGLHHYCLACTTTLHRHMRLLLLGKVQAFFRVRDLNSV
jgi:hypothetical protein